MDEKEKQQALEEEQARLQALKVLYFLQVCIARYFFFNCIQVKTKILIQSWLGNSHLKRDEA